ncbi:cupin domain-containing protein [filamentous cyanobacterium CCP5]|nr:cupin domain-containing protein [filamentous cyanobacterium CCP5]
MTEASIKKVNISNASEGEMGQAYLASGANMAMRLWQDETPSDNPKPTSQRDYEVLGYVLKGKAELHLDSQSLTLEPGDSWVVPAGTPHTYRILEPFSALETTIPPARVSHRDAAKA